MKYEKRELFLDFSCYLGWSSIRGHKRQHPSFSNVYESKNLWLIANIEICGFGDTLTEDLWNQQDVGFSLSLKIYGEFDNLSSRVPQEQDKFIYVRKDSRGRHRKPMRIPSNSRWTRDVGTANTVAVTHGVPWNRRERLENRMCCPSFKNTGDVLYSSSGGYWIMEERTRRENAGSGETEGKRHLTSSRGSDSGARKRRPEENFSRC